MIKEIPGWANFFILYAVYLVLGELVNWIFFGWSIDHKYIAIITALFCGAYLAKWRFYDDGWRFW